MRRTFLPFALPDLDATEFQSIREVLESGWITTGVQTRRFEGAFAAAVGATHAVAVNSCTAAMHLALEAIGLQRGDEVITSSYTFAATAEVVRYFDARPVLVDIRPEDFNLDPALVRAAITPRTRAIIVVHIGGLAADLEAIAALAIEHKLALIEDAAHALPTRYHGRLIGSARLPPELPHFVCFSFYATKTLTTGEGGMIVTNHEAMAERCRIMALHGISRDAWKRYTSEGSWYYEIVAPGYKYNMTDIAAAMGLAQLAKVEHMSQRRHTIARAYHAAFADLPELQLAPDPERQRLPSCSGCACRPGQLECRHAWQLYMLRLNLESLRIDRAQFIAALKARNIGSSVHFIPLHLHPYYCNKYGYRPEDYPVAYREFQREVSLPIYSKMLDEDLEDVITAVRAIVAEHRR